MDYREAVRLAKSSVLEALAVHEPECPRTDPEGRCWKERVNVVAFIAHALGMKPAQLIEASKVLVRYNGEHEEGLHGHEDDVT